MNTNNNPPYDGWFSEQQVKSLLVSVQLFSGANGNQGLAGVAGGNFGERAEVMMKSFLTSSSHLDTVKKIKTPLEEYELS